jgi:Na+-translocating ferredoxin:NAD+ oxidoreductase RNF subunit RnfB
MIPLDFEKILLAFFAMALLGLVLSALLSLAHRVLFVPEDPRIEGVAEMLPGTNCGACGNPSCLVFAEALVAETVSPAQCTVSSVEEAERIAEYLGVAVGEIDRQLARLACAGGTNVARQRAWYEGYPSCQAADLVAGGAKGCAWGCLGLGDCERSCDFDAIIMNEQGLPEVDSEKCTACGDCVDACPKDLFSLEPVRHKLWVACKNLLFDEEAERECEVACTGCGLCVADAAPGLITMQDNLAVINRELMELASKEAIRRCPTGAIVWIEEDEKEQKGDRAKKIIRKSPLPVG